MTRLKRSVVMIGMMGAGKTAVGRAVAELLGVDFVDSDAAIVEASAMSIAEIFERDGEAFFRARESEVLDRLLDGGPSVISTGGGVFMSERNRELIAGRGSSVWLDVPLKVLWARVSGKDTRPLLRTANPYQTLADLFEARVPIYALADVQVKGDARVSVDAMAHRVVDALEAFDVVDKESHDGTG